MFDFTDELKALRERLAEAQAYLRIDALRARRPQLEAEMGRPDLWDNTEVARQVQTELSEIVGDIDLYEELEGRIDDAATLFELAREESDDSVESEIRESIEGTKKRFDELELRALFTGEYDERDAVCTVKSGAGGTDAQDWAEMLLRMYRRWAERRGFQCEIDYVSEGTEAGISTAEFIVKGRYAYGLLRAEHGVHRLVRISPFNNEGKRQTAFASLTVAPFFEEMAARGRDQRQGPAHRRVPLVGRGRPARQRHRLGGAHHPSADGHRGRLPERAQPAPEQGAGDAGPRGQAARSRAAQARRADLVDLGPAERRQLRQPDPQLRAAALPDGERRAHAAIRSGDVDSVLDGEIDEFMEAYLRDQRAKLAQSE